MQELRTAEVEGESRHAGTWGPVASSEAQGLHPGLKRGLWTLTASTEKGTSAPRLQGAGLTCHPPKFTGGFSQEPPDEASSLADSLISTF